MKKDSFYPLFIDISERLSVVIGGGRVAERKVKTLLRFKGKVRVISPQITKGLKRLEEKGRIEVIRKTYEDCDIEGAFMVFAATNQREVNERIKKEAEKRGILVNVVDEPTLCDFYVPATIKKGKITIAISTQGNLPLLAKMIRKELEKNLKGSYLKYYKILKNFRTILIKKIEDPKARLRIMREIEKRDMEEVIKMGSKGLRLIFGI